MIGSGGATDPQAFVPCTSRPCAIVAEIKLLLPFEFRMKACILSRQGAGSIRMYWRHWCWRSCWQQTQLYRLDSLFLRHPPPRAHVRLNFASKVPSIGKLLHDTELHGCWIHERFQEPNYARVSNARQEPNFGESILNFTVGHRADVNFFKGICMWSPC